MDQPEVDNFINSIDRLSEVEALLFAATLVNRTEMVKDLVVEASERVRRVKQFLAVRYGTTESSF